MVRTLVFARRNDEASVLDALHAGRTVVYGIDGKPVGHPEMIALLEREPYVFEDHDYNYRGSSWADRSLRMLGLMGLLGMVLFRPRRE